MLKEGMFIQGRYEIVGKIGTGGMADVYKAKDHKLNRFVAVKVLKAEFRQDKAFITKFRAEAQAAAGLAHPNIVNIYDVGEDRGVNFIVMELVEGITLKEYIGKKGKLAVREATSIAIQVSQGLEAAHNSGIVHRDIKPQNIIISTDGKVKVTDFGIARATSSNTISTAVMGSVHYSSPEQARGGYSDAKSDIYSLGISLYEMLTGQVPFDGDTTVAIAIKHLQEEIKSPEIYVPNLPKSTVQIIYKCTQKSPDRRYSSMSELIYDLKESLINPDGDFVQIVNPNSAGRTVVISKEELGAIKGVYTAPRGTGETMPKDGMKKVTGPAGYDIPAGGAPANAGNAQNAGYNKNIYEQPYDPYTYSRAYGKRGYDYEEDRYDNGQGFREDEEDKGILSPKLEKIMTVGSIVIAILIACIFLGLIANALGIVRFSLPGIFGGREQSTEKVTETQAPEEQPQETNAPVEQPQETPQETEAPVQIETQTQETEAPETPTEETQTQETEATADPGEVTVPDVVGLDFETAQDLMMAAGFYVERQDDPSDTVEAGIVMDQSATGVMKPSSTVILIVSAGPETGGDNGDGDALWMCNAELTQPEGYNGENARLELHQGDSVTVLAEGSIQFPYILEMESTVGEGDVVMYLQNSETGVYELFVTYPVPFQQVN